MTSGIENRARSAEKFFGFGREAGAGRKVSAGHLRKESSGDTSRVLRGASWNNNDASNTLSSNRNNNDAGDRNNNIGFRCVLVVGGRKAFNEPNNRRDVRPGQKPLRTRAKKSLTRMTSPWEKQTHGWSVAMCHAWGWRSLR
jgi:hypothetical protein